LNGDFLQKSPFVPPFFSLGELTGGTPQRNSRLISGYYRFFKKILFSIENNIYLSLYAVFTPRSFAAGAYIAGSVAMLHATIRPSRVSSLFSRLEVKKAPPSQVMPF